MNIAQSIIADRIARGITQDELATELGVTQQAVSGWEEGKSTPRQDRLTILAEFFGPTSNTAAALRTGRRRRVADKDCETALALLQEAVRLLSK